MKTIRWGMIGCGDVTEIKSGPAFNKVPGSRLLAVMCRTQGRAENYARRHGIPRWYTDAAELIHDREVDAIYIATPPDSHSYYTAMAARVAKPVYVEKPMARNYRECKQMIEVCEKQDVPLYVAYYRRRLPKFLRVQQLLRDGVIGDVRTVSVHLHWPPRPEDLSPDHLPWRVIPEISGGGYFIDLASHQLDLLDFLLGPIVTASGVKANQAGWYPAEDTVTAYFSFKNGVPGSGSWCFTVNEANRLDRTEITGSKGTLVYSNFDASPIRVVNEKGMGQYTEPWPEHVQSPLIQTVVEALQGEDRCPSTGISAARTSRVMDMILGNPI